MAFGLLAFTFFLLHSRSNRTPREVTFGTGYTFRCLLLLCVRLLDSLYPLIGILLRNFPDAAAAVAKVVVAVALYSNNNISSYSSNNTASCCHSSSSNAVSPALRKSRAGVRKSFVLVALPLSE